MPVVEEWEHYGYSKDDWDLLHAVDHTPLTGLGWSDYILRAIALVLGFDHLGDWKYRAATIADCVSEYMITGNPIRYSRDQRQYSYFTWLANPMMTYRTVLDVVDGLRESGLIHHIRGYKHDWKKYGRQSIFWPTLDVIDKVAPLLHTEVREPVVDIRYDSIRLKDKDGVLQPFEETTQVCRWREELVVLNGSIKATVWTFGGQRMDIGLLVRIFNKNFRRGGRLYVRGESYQGFSKEMRSMIKMEWKGELLPTTEEDYTSQHIYLAYGQLGLRPPEGDLYYVDFWERDVIKGVILRLFNASSERAAINSILFDKVLDDRKKAEAAVEAVKALHPKLVCFFGSDTGAKLQRIDADMAVKVMLRFFYRVGYSPLPIHDSFIVAAIHRDILREIMTEVMNETLAAGPRRPEPVASTEPAAEELPATTKPSMSTSPTITPLGTTDEPDQHQQDLAMYRAFEKRRDRAIGNYPDDWGPEPDIPWHEDPDLLQHRYQLASVEAEWKQHRQDCDTRRYRWKWNPLTQEEYDYLTGEQAEDSFHVWRRQREIEILGRPLGHLEWKNTPKNLKRRRLKERTRKATAKELREAKALMISLLGPDFA